MLLIGSTSPAELVHDFADRANSSHRSCMNPFMATENGKPWVEWWRISPAGGAMSVAGMYRGRGMPASRAATAWSTRSWIIASCSGSRCVRDSSRYWASSTAPSVSAETSSACSDAPPQAPRAASSTSPAEKKETRILTHHVHRVWMCRSCRESGLGKLGKAGRAGEGLESTRCLSRKGPENRVFPCHGMSSVRLLGGAGEETGRGNAFPAGGDFPCVPDLAVGLDSNVSGWRAAR